MPAALEKLLSAVVMLPYTSTQYPGITALVLAGFISLTSILAVFVVVTVLALKARIGRYHLFAQTHILPYFVSLLVANFSQSIGSIINITWLNEGGVTFNHSCITQGITKNVGNVGGAIWSLTLSIHAFDVLFLRNQQKKRTVYITLVALWVVIFLIDLIGPVLVEKADAGPFFGISGYWCWITASYPLSQVFLEYIWMFFSAFACGIIYLLIYLRLRGNLGGSGLKMKFRRIPKAEQWAVKLSRDEVDSSMYKLSQQLMLYPLVYLFVILPIAFGRFLFYVAEVPFWYIILADFIFNLNGFFNVAIFLYTLKYSAENNIPVKLSTARRSIFATNFGITPFVIPADTHHTTISAVHATKEISSYDVDVEKGDPDSRRGSVQSFQSHESTAPLTGARLPK